MTTLPDLLYVALFAVGGAVCGRHAAVGLPRLGRRFSASYKPIRLGLGSGAGQEPYGYPWALVAVGAALWIANDRAWASLGFSVPEWLAVVGSGWPGAAARGTVTLLGRDGLTTA